MKNLYHSINDSPDEMRQDEKEKVDLPQWHQERQWELSTWVLCGLDAMTCKTAWTCIQNPLDHWRKLSWGAWWDLGWGRSGCRSGNFWPSRQAQREESNQILKKRRKGILFHLYPQPSAQDTHTHCSQSTHGHIANIPHQCWAGRLQSGPRLCFVSVHSDVRDDQWPI